MTFSERAAGHDRTPLEPLLLKSPCASNNRSAIGEVGNCGRPSFPMCRPLCPPPGIRESTPRRATRTTEDRAFSVVPEGPAGRGRLPENA
jgi:hypothetical protein